MCTNCDQTKTTLKHNKTKPQQNQIKFKTKQNLIHNIQPSQTSLHFLLKSHIMSLQKLCSDSSNETTLSELGDHKEYAQNLVLGI